MQLLKKLRTLLPYSEIHLIVIFVGLMLLSFINPLYIILFLLYDLFLFKKKKISIIYFLLGVFILGLYLYLVLKPTTLPEKLIKEEIVIKETKKSYYLAKYQRETFVFYSKAQYKAGDIVKVSGDFKKPNSTNLKYLFDFKDYLINRKIRKTFTPKEEEITGFKFQVALIKESLCKRIDITFEEKNASYIKALLLADTNSFDEEIRENIDFLGLGHLLSISGLHVNLFIIFLTFIFRIFGLKEKSIKSFFLAFLIIYAIITLLSPSILRVVICYILKTFFIKFKVSYTSLDILSFSFIFIIVFNPLYFFHTGFQLSYCVSFALVLSKFISLEKNLIFSALKMSLLAISVSFPLVANITNEINLISIIANIFVVLFFSYILLPATFGIIILKPLEFIYSEIIVIFELLVKILGKIEFLSFKMPNFNAFFIILYYFFLFEVLVKIERKKNICINAFLIILVVFFNITRLNYYPYDEVGFFDVGQGDSTYILLKNNSCNILIDFYGDEYLYLFKKGVKRIDYLILSHGHADHAGNLDSLSEKFAIKNFLYSAFDRTDLTNEIKNKAIEKKIKTRAVMKDDKFCCGGKEFKILAPFKSFDNLNNVSVVLQFNLLGKTFLLMGDSEVEQEKLLMEYYGKSLKSDILKVGHHGSKTSSAKEFLELVNPDLAVISVSEINRYNLPSPSVLVLFQEMNISVHLTYQRQSLILKGT